jgi:putative transposase
MRKFRFIENQIVRILKEAEAGRPVTDLCRENAISSTTFYKWKAKFGGMEASGIRRLKDLEAEHSRLKPMYADLSLENRALKDVIAK